MLMASLLITAHRFPALFGGARWVDSYLDDLLLMPLVLGGLLLAMRIKSGRRSWVVPVPLAVAALVGYAVYFEVFLPRMSPHATGDGLDVVAYAVGLLFFMTFLNRPAGAGDQGDN